MDRLIREDDCQTIKPMRTYPTLTAEDASHYSPQIDGLRAIAVLSVMLFHAGFDVFSGGYVGVDVFFVISGYLISRLIWTERQAGHFSLSHFYVRRARRILPALFFVMLACVAPAVWLMSPGELKDFFQTMTAASLFYSNFFLASHSGYFDLSAEIRPLLHTWSLAVEEQYYLLFPLLTAWIWRFPNRARVLILVALAMLSLAFAVWGLDRDRMATFFLGYARAWELLFGVIAMILAPACAGRCAANVRETLAMFGLIAVLGSIVLFLRSTDVPGLPTLIPVIGTGLVLVFAETGTFVARALSVRPLVIIGLLSYSAYLWHQPLLAFARIYWLGPLPRTQSALLIAVALVLAAPTWMWVEQPLRRMQHLPSRAVFLLAMFVTTVVSAIGIYGSSHDWAVGNIMPVSVQSAFAPPPRTTECFDLDYAHERADHWNCEINPAVNKSVDFVVFGDSHGLQLLSAFEEAAIATNRHGLFAGFSGCAPLLGVYPLTRPNQKRHDCNGLNKRIFEYVRKNSIHDVYLVGKWSYYTDHLNGTDDINALGLKPGDPISIAGTREAFSYGVGHTAHSYRVLGVRLHIVEQVPMQRLSPEAVYQRLWSHNLQHDAQRLRAISVTVSEHRQLQAFANSIFQNTSNIETINLDLLFCEADICPIGTALVPLYQDQSHLNANGAALVVPRLTRSLAANNE